MPAQTYQQNDGRAEMPKPKRRVYINQNLFRDPFERLPGYNNAGCDLCEVVFQNPEEMEQHKATDSHQIRETYHTRRKDLPKTIDGVKILQKGSSEEDSERINIKLQENKADTFYLVVLNEMDKPFYVYKIFKICKLTDIIIPLAEKDLQLNILPKGQIEIDMRVNDLGLGAYLIPLVFKIRGDNEGDNFKYILKEVVFRSQTELMEMLAPLSPYKPLLPNITNEMEEPIIHYDQPKRKEKRRSSRVPPKEYKIPPRLKYLVMKVICNKQQLPAEERSEWNENLALLKSTLTLENYAKRFSLLLHLEELQAEYEMLKYGQNGEVLDITRGGLYKLEVPGLAEKRPSVLRGDVVHVRMQNHSEFRYEGFVQEVHEHTVLLDFHKKFKVLYKPGMKVDIRFTLNRLPLKFYHRAVEILSMKGTTSILFPSSDISYPTLQQSLKPWRFEKMKNNYEQQQAVSQIVNKAAMPAPYLVFGPPGTGKTVTIVEAIAQVWLLNESNPEKQLVCAPTNTTADLLTVGLLKAVPKAKILRIYAMSVDITLIHKDIPKKQTNISEGNVTFTDNKKIESYDIIVTTLVTAGRLVTAGLKQGHFKYVYVDECGQALEPEALIPVAGILTTEQKPGGVSGQLVLAGDPKQLGPVLQSTLSKQHGLELSLLERLMDTNDLYKKDPVTRKYNSKYLTKLVQNFRSHEHILTVPNEMFYDNDLQTKGEKSVIMRCIGWNQLPNRQFPLIFHGIEGIDERECSSPSYFNRQEIDQVIKYMEKLINGSGGVKVKQDDIGIITPYRKQVQKFNRVFKILNWTRVKIGTVEQFQGDERLVIIISTVRSSQELLDYDFKFKLGFLKNPKRFNVAVTRAKALVIMVGNPHILCHDKHWLKFMNFVRDNGGACGTSWSNPKD